MTITEIKNIKKLQSRLKSALDELKYIKKCCENAGLELEKHSYYYDHKEKNLVIQAMKLNEEFERREKAFKEIEKAIAIYSSRHQFSIANDLYNQILDIINKVKEEN